MPSLLLPTRRQAVGHCLVAAVTVVLCAGLLTAALLLGAPVAVTPLLALVCVGCPLVLAWSLPASVAVLRLAAGPRRATIDVRAARRLRRQLRKLPETPHPLGH